MSKTYNTEIISVGTELLLGHVTNTDARDVSELLSKIGINVLYHTVVGDNPQLSLIHILARWPRVRQASFPRAGRRDAEKPLRQGA